MTPEEIGAARKVIEELSRFECCHLWRFAPSGHPYFDRSKPLWAFFEKRFKELGGFNPEISKALGWEKPT